MILGMSLEPVTPGTSPSTPPEPYRILFEPVPIGPLVARNRFFGVPHCNGMGYRDPSAQAGLRRVKAEGGWAVVCTEQAEIHPTSDITPFIELRLWDDQDLPALAAIAAAIHEGGALAGIELCHNGLNAPNLYSRETPLGPHHLPVAAYGYDPGPGPDDDQAGHRRPAALAPQRGAARDAGRLRPAVGELPDLWDFVLGSWEADSATSRFGPEGEQEQYVAGLKQLTSKPVVGVGRFTSPDLMVRQVKDGILDFIGAARPSIADPFLPDKIRTGRLETIRECIGCNICVSGDFTMSPIRCTQNPAMGEEFRRGWHPERIRPRGSDARILVAGSGPAGLEAARALGVRGYEVVLTEATRQLGGRVAREAKLPGLAAWIRVLDYRQQALGDLPSVEVYRESRMTAADIVEAGFRHVAVATGATWRRDGVARWHTQPIPVGPAADVLIPDDLMAGWRPAGSRVVVYDDDHCYLGGVLAELLQSEGFEVEIVTPAPQVPAWTVNTMEVDRIQRRLLLAGVALRTSAAMTEVAAGKVTVASAYTGQLSEAAADSVVMVTARLPEDELYLDLVPGGTAVRSPRSAPSATPGHRARSRPPSGPAAGSPRSSTRTCQATTWCRSGARSPGCTRTGRELIALSNETREKGGARCGPAGWRRSVMGCSPSSSRSWCWSSKCPRGTPSPSCSTRPAWACCRTC
jgi:2,4-dienoyl-CoA reductase-like NADH-dependent reductase (Old Yellow Enzyme family)